MLIGNKNDLDPCAKYDDPSTIPQNLKAGPARVPYEQCERVINPLFDSNSFIIVKSFFIIKMKYDCIACVYFSCSC